MSKNTEINVIIPTALFALWSINLIEERHPKDKLCLSPAQAFSILKGMSIVSPCGKDRS